VNIWLITVGEPLPSDGPNARLYRTGLLADKLVSQGHNVMWWTSTLDHTKKVQRFAHDTTIVLAPNYKLKLLHSIAYSESISLKRILNHIGIAWVFSREAAIQQRPDIILVSLPTLELSLAAVKYGKRHNIPVVVDIRDLWPDIFLRVFSPMIRPVGRLAIHPFFLMAEAACCQAAAIIGITSKFVAWGLDYARRPATQWDVDFPLAYPDVKPADEAIDTAEKFWEQCGIGSKENSFIVCFFGTMGWQFDIETVIKAAEILEKHEKGITFVLCGTGDNLEKYKQIAASTSNIIFPGWVGAAEIWTLMRRSRVGLAPYYSTPDFEMAIPNKVIEYLSAGLPVVTSLRDTVAGLVEQNNCGLTYQQGNPHELANILVNLHSQPQNLITMSKNAHSLYEERFTADKVYGELAKHLENIVHHYKAGE
jgi:glycosyltransferase involved in cell wall biosynthesis